jgi:NAD(P)-dependent dehydrogenase (short-subunit alcohol dehydrogenase family)
VSGANRGIGLAIADELNRRGWHVSAGVRQPGRADALRKVLDPARSLIAPYDAKDGASAAIWVKTTLDKFGQIDAVVANSGIYIAADVATGDEKSLDELWAVNAKGPWLLVRAALEPLKKCGHGRVVLMSSLGGKRVRAEHFTGYAMSKFALMAFAQGLRLHGWDHGIRVCALCPGTVATDMVKQTGSGRVATKPETMAQLTAMALELPNETYLPEIGVASVLETGWA